MDYITGASGFLGKHLRAKLGEDVICVPHDEIMSWEFRDCDRFFYLSSYGNMAGQNDAAEILLANVAQVGAVLTGLIDREWTCESFVFVSSSSVTLPVQTPYSRAKWAAEEMILASGVPACIVRPYSITGIGEQKQHLIPRLIRSCMEGEPMDFTPQPTHNFVDVSDVCDGLLRLADERQAGIHEFGTGQAITNEAVLNLVQEACGRYANVRTVNSLRSYDDFNWRCINPSEFWIQKKPLIMSIKQMVQAYKNEHPCKE